MITTIIITTWQKKISIYKETIVAEQVYNNDAKGKDVVKNGYHLLPFQPSTWSYLITYWLVQTAGTHQNETIQFDPHKQHWKEK